MAPTPSASTSDTVVSLEVADGVAHVTIERPDKRNAMSMEVFDQLIDRAEQIADDPAVGAVVVSGRGEVFSSGIDVSVFGAQVSDGADPSFLLHLQEAFNVYEDLDVPTVAAIQGYCFGGGLQLALACHIRMVAPSAQLSVMEARWALIPDLGGTWRLPRLIGLGRATELTLTARRVPADEALAMGLVEVALPADGALDAAHDYAAALAAGPGALRRTPRLIRENLERDRPTALRIEGETQMRCMRGPDFSEAVSAHLEGREPSFEGR